MDRKYRPRRTIEGTPANSFRRRVWRAMDVTGSRQIHLARLWGVHGDQVSRIVNGNIGLIGKRDAALIEVGLKAIEDEYRLPVLSDDTCPFCGVAPSD